MFRGGDLLHLRWDGRRVVRPRIDDRRRGDDAAARDHLDLGEAPSDVGLVRPGPEGLEVLDRHPGADRQRVALDLAAVGGVEGDVHLRLVHAGVGDVDVGAELALHLAQAEQARRAARSQAGVADAVKGLAEGALGAGVVDPRHQLERLVEQISSAPLPSKPRPSPTTSSKMPWAIGSMAPVAVTLPAVSVWRMNSTLASALALFLIATSVRHTLPAAPWLFAAISVQ